VPLNPKLVQTAYRRQSEIDGASLEDFTPTDFSAQPDDAPEAAAPALSSKRGSPRVAEASVTVAVDESGDIAVPDFSGKTMRDVTDECLRLGLNPSLVGTNLAIAQSPAPAARVKRGAKVTVEFGIPEAKTARAHPGMKN
jgi:hypothetical protein